MSAGLTGFFTGFSLILAIGAQNALVLRQGLLSQHVLPLVLFCALSDALLIAAGVAGFGALVEAWPALPLVMTLGGAAFLVAYGINRLWAAWRGGQHMDQAQGGQSLTRTLALAAAFTWANPHVYLDTLGLIGAISTTYPDWPARVEFGAGAVIASFTFFFSLGYGARVLSPLMARARSWQVLDVLIGLTMLAIAAKLLSSLL